MNTILKDYDASADVRQTVRTILEQHGRLARDVSQIVDSNDLYEAGLTSLASVNVMLALEGAFQIEFPDQMLNRAMFASIDAIVDAVDKVRGL